MCRLTREDAEVEDKGPWGDDENTNDAGEYLRDPILIMKQWEE